MPRKPGTQRPERATVGEPKGQLEGFFISTAGGGSVALLVRYEPRGDGPAPEGPARVRYSSAASSALVMRVAPCSRMRRWVPADAALVTGPGTAPTGRPSAVAWFAVFSEPERHPASVTITVALLAAIIRLRWMNRHLVGGVPHGTSDTTAPDSTMRVRSASCPAGVEPVDATGEVGDRAPVGRQRCAVGHAVDAVGGS
jgi:hypothetical protein